MPAAVIAAGVVSSLVIVMVASDIGIEVQTACSQRLRRLVHTAGHTAIQLDARRRQSRF